MDDIERAQETEQMHRQAALAAQSQRRDLPAIGECHNCAATVPSGALYCDVDCRQDHERHLAASRRNGRKP